MRIIHMPYGRKRPGTKPYLILQLICPLILFPAVVVLEWLVSNLCNRKKWGNGIVFVASLMGRR